MAKLELRHLAPYLPFKLRVMHGDKNKVMNAGQGSSVNWIGINAVISWQDTRSGVKPILRPLSDINKEITHDEKTFNAFEKLKRLSFEGLFTSPELDLMKSSDGLADTESWIVWQLLSWHFDVFELIPKGLAIDFNTLETESEEEDFSEQVEKIKEEGFRVSLPIIKSKKTDNYALVLTDSAGVNHYFNFDGTYDGYSSEPEVDGETGMNLN